MSVRAGRARFAGDEGAAEIAVRQPFSLLREVLGELAPLEAPAPADFELPLTGGAFGLVDYDAGRYIERLPSLAADDLGLPELVFIFPRRLIAFDHRRHLAHLLFEDALPGELDHVTELLKRQSSQPAPPADPAGLDRHAFSLSAATRSNLSRESFQHMVRRAKEYILAGDIFQSNLSQRLELAYGGDSLDLYDALRTVNPSPFAGYLDLGPHPGRAAGGFQVISSSPERLVQLEGRRAQTRPIAGTRRRGVDFAEDGSLTDELNLDPKERAEHIMLVDLERNDMGRVCDYGSVRVNELMVNEHYSHVIHIVSNVQGALHQQRDALDLLKAMFPGGTITGCPKVRCMQIIDELEPVRRGPYTGSFGYIGYGGGNRAGSGAGPAGNMDMNIIIRTLVRLGDRVYAQAGAGIVADSDPEREYRETLRKAEAMVRAVELAGRRAATGPSRLSFSP
jgi:anthranilate/para-aminobenzoate synthase component I